MTIREASWQKRPSDYDATEVFYERDADARPAPDPRADARDRAYISGVILAAIILMYWFW